MPAPATSLSTPEQIIALDTWQKDPQGCPFSCPEEGIELPHDNSYAL